MTRSTRDILKQILTLPSIERAALVEEIHRNLDSAEDPNVTLAWAEEAEGRIDAYDRNQIPGRDYKQVRGSLPHK